MSAITLYRQVKQVLQSCLPAGVSETTEERVALLVLGMIKAKSAAPARIARALAQLGVSGAQAESIERRIRRIENDPEVTATLCFHPYARQRLLWSRPEALVLIVDPTSQDERVVMVSVAVWYRGRALPLTWAAWPANRPLTGDGFWVRIAALLAAVATLLPKHTAVTLVADRAFGTPAFTDLVTAQGWHYLVRVQGQTRCRDRLKREKQVVALLPPHRNRVKMRGQVFKKHKWRPASVVVFWGRRQQTPLCLVSDLPPGWYLIALYRQRFPIEATFRDYKSLGWQWEQGQVTALDHVQRLLVGMALATWLAIGTGAQVAASYLARPPSGHRRTRPWVAKQSLFQLGLDQLQAYLQGTCPLTLWSRLSDWEASNWSQQITNHHARAFVFTCHR